jgi:hypothetical protein
VQWRWSPKQALRFGAPVDVPGIAYTFVIDSREGNWRIERRFGNPRRPDVPADRLFAPGFFGQALAMPVHFSSLDPPKLNIEEARSSSGSNRLGTSRSVPPARAVRWSIRC